MVNDCHTQKDVGVHDSEYDQEKFATQHSSAKEEESNESLDDMDETSSNSCMACLKEILVKIFCPTCFVYPFLAVVVVVVTVVLVVEATTKDDVNVTPIIIKDYTDMNATSAPTNTSLFLSSAPSKSPVST